MPILGLGLVLVSGGVLKAAQGHELSWLEAAVVVVAVATALGVAWWVGLYR